MRFIKERVTSKNKMWITAFVAFIVVFAIQVYFNSYVIILRSLPDEMGAIYMAAKLAGNDWSYVMTHPPMYYGNMITLIIYPFFKCIHDSFILYKVLLGVGAFLRAVPSIICFYISYKYIEIKNLKILFFLSIACCFFTPTRATNIDNEPGLILCCWLLILIIMALANSVKGKSILSVLFSLVLCISLLAHTRAIIYILSAVMVIAFFQFLTGKALVNYKSFGGSFCICYVLSKLMINYCTKILYPVGNGVQIPNTSNGLITSIKNGFSKMLGEYGIQSFIDLLASNTLVIFVFSGGLIIFGFFLFFICFYCCCKKRIILKQDIFIDSLFFPLMFCVFGSGMGILGVCVTWINSALNQHIDSENLSRGYFYLRYYSMFFGPMLMILVGCIKKKIITPKVLKKLFILLFLVIEICTSYSYFSFLDSVTKQYIHNSDWFCYFAPFSMKFERWPDVSQSFGYYYMAIKIAIILAILFYYLWGNGNYIGVVLCTVFISLYQYAYSVINWDRPFCYSENYYQSVNGLRKFEKEYDYFLNSIDRVYYMNQRYGPQYIVQFVLMKTLIITDCPPEDEANVIIISNSIDYVLEKEIDPKEYWYTSLDDNEYIFVKGNSYIELFAEKGIEIQPLEKARE